MHQQLDMLTLASTATGGTLSQGTVVNRGSIARAASRKFGHASVTCMRDSEVERVVTEIRLYECSAYVESRTLFDFNKDRNCWMTEGESRRVEIADLKEAKGIALAMVAELDAMPHRTAMGAVEMFH